MVPHPRSLGAVRVNGSVTVPRAELEVRVSRSGGPGGQHVNTSSTRVELRWNLDRSSALSDAQKARARAALGSRLASDGTLRIVSSEYRSQLRNREAAEARFAATLRRALVVPRARRATKRPKRAQEARLEEKRKQSDRKKRRRWTADD